MATVGGNLLQRPRCWYFRAGHGLLAMKDGKSLVRAGDNRYHAIFMTDGDALFVTPSSLAVALAALDAQATLTGPKGERTVKVEELYQVPKTEKDSELTIGPGEILTKVTIPAAKGKSASYEARHKQAQDWPLVLASVNLAMDGDSVSAAKIFVYGVAPIPWRSAAAEKAITGKRMSIETRRHRRRSGHRRRCPALDERLQGGPDQDRRQAGAARGCRQPLLGGGLTSLHSMADTEPDELPVARRPIAPCRHLRNKGMYVYTDGIERRRRGRLRQHRLLVLANHEELRPGRRHGRRPGMPRPVAVVLRTALTDRRADSHQIDFSDDASRTNRSFSRRSFFLAAAIVTFATGAMAAISQNLDSLS